MEKGLLPKRKQLHEMNFKSVVESMAKTVESLDETSKIAATCSDLAQKGKITFFCVCYYNEALYIHFPLFRDYFIIIHDFFS